MDRILVLYGTTDGHTAIIAETIGDTLRATGFDADVIRAGTLDPRPADYAGIVVAASVQAGGYQKPVGRWLAAHVREFGDRPTAFVTACLGVLQKDPKVDADLDGITRRFLDAAGWQPTVRKVVAGALLYRQYGFLKRWIMKRIVAKAGGETDTSRDYDYTDWADVRAFARSFGRQVADVRSPRTTAGAAMTAGIMIAVAAAQALAQTPDPGARAMQAFELATRDYVQMHRRLESQIGAIRLNSTVAEVNRTIQELAAAIRAERPDAKQGDFFTAELAVELRARISSALSEHGFTPGDVREHERLDALEAGAAVLRVNGTFPWVLATAMFPCIIAALPPVSPELQYRIVGNTLVLVDVHASLIVDLLPNALVEATFDWAGTIPRRGENPAAEGGGGDQMAGNSPIVTGMTVAP